MRALPLSFLAMGLLVGSIPVAAQYMRGVNISGAEFGSNSENPGTSNIPGQYGSTYWYQSAPTFDYFGARGLNFLRVEILWERLQPTLQGPLDPANLGYLKNDIAWAKAAGSVININLQNYGRYTIKGVPCIIDNSCNGSVQVTGADLADFWSKMAAEFVDEPGVYSYDIMNEPHDMGVANWNQISQEVVSAIRLQDPNKAIMVEGDSWANATNWASNNGATGWITDPGNNTWYEGHVYFDHDYSGTYGWTYDQELTGNSDLVHIGVTRLAPFVSWCTTNNVKCYVGEYGIPDGGPQPADFANTLTDPRWLTVLDNFLTALDQAGLPSTYWAAGERWGDYPLSVQPLDNFTTDTEQLPTLLNHLQPNLLRTTSAAASYGYTVAPGELVAGYGHALAAGPQIAMAPWPSQIGDTQVQVTDANGTTSFAGLLYVSDSQINYQLPAGMATGLAQVSVLDNGAPVSSGILEVQPVSPSIFTMNDDGYGVPAAFVQPVPTGGGEPAPVLVATYNTSTGQWVAAPIVFNGQNLELMLLGTGFDAETSNTQVQVQIGTTIVQPTSVGPGGGYPGEDEIVVPLPSSLAGSGQVNVQAQFKTLVNGTVTYTYTNPVTITFQ